MPLAVIDTNVVLDLWWFEDPRTAALAHALETGHLHWLVTEPMQQELHEVLGRTPFAERPDRCQRVMAHLQDFGRLAEPAARQAPVCCADPDDQMFIDLALEHGAAWLFSRDRALLTLAPRLLGWRCTVLEPAAWRPGDNSISASDPAP